MYVDTTTLRASVVRGPRQHASSLKRVTNPRLHVSSLKRVTNVEQSIDAARPLNASFRMP